MTEVIIENKKINISSDESIAEIVSSNFDYSDIVAVKINDSLIDLSEKVTGDCIIELIKSSDPEGLDIIRHTCAHVFGHAIKQIYPNTKMVIGPVIDNGFYYDIYAENSISEKELSQIEMLMNQ